MKYWEIIADNLSKSCWSWGYVSTVDARGWTIFGAGYFSLFFLLDKLMTFFQDSVP
jgi:hypothetical protein